MGREAAGAANSCWKDRSGALPATASEDSVGVYEEDANSHFQE